MYTLDLDENLACVETRRNSSLGVASIRELFGMRTSLRPRHMSAPSALYVLVSSGHLTMHILMQMGQREASKGISNFSTTK